MGLFSTRSSQRYLIAGGVCAVLFARIAHLHYVRHQLLQRLLHKYETEGTKQDGRLSNQEVVRLLRDNGVDVTVEQLGKWVGGVDDEHDGFDGGELVEAIEYFDDFATAKGDLLDLGYQPFGVSAFGDVGICVAVALTIGWALFNAQHIEKRIAANSFVSAVKMSKMKREWKALDDKIKLYDAKMEEMEKEHQSLKDENELAMQRATTAELEYERANTEAMHTPKDELARMDEERQKAKEEAEHAKQRLEKHTQELAVLREKEERAQSELTRLRLTAEQHMQEKHLSTQKLKAMTSSLKGLDAFKGAATGNYKEAQAGFGNSTGFRMETFVFGYPTNDDVVMFEVNKRKDLLGEGADCAYKCRNIATDEKFALKIYSMGDGGHRRQILSDLHTKRLIQNHPHIVQYHHVIETEAQIFVLMELIPGKDLFSDIIDRSGYSESRAARVFSQVCEALDYLHERDIVHGDMKPENVMIEKPQGDQPHAKVIDFGFSCFLNIEPRDHVGLVHNFYTPVLDVYSPPEAHTTNGQACSKMTKSMDMFRMGCLLYVMLMATYPFDRSGRDTDNRKAGKVLQYPKWNTLSEDSRDLIVTCIRDRISAAEARRHPWVTRHVSAAIS